MGQEERQKFLRLIINGIIFEGDKVRIKGIIPLESLGTGKIFDALRMGGERIFRASSGIMTTGIYRHGHNAADDTFFELLKAMPKSPNPLHQQLTPELLHRLIRQHSGDTLQQLCEQVKLESGVSLSITSMSRLLRRNGLTCKARRQLQVVCAAREGMGQDSPPQLL